MDSFAPNPDAAEIHTIVVDASPETVYLALWTADLGSSLIIKLLLGLRSLPEFISRGGRLPPDRKLTLQTIIDSGFGLLVDGPEEIVLGVTGKFWRPTGNLSPFCREDFEGPVTEGVARAVWNFSIEKSDQSTILTTETRVVCGDDASRRKFRLYWFFVRPFSGLIRLLMLRAVRWEVGGGSTSK